MTPQPNSAALALTNSMLAHSSFTASAATATAAATKATATKVAKAGDAAKDFEAVFLNTLFQQMFSTVSQGQFSGGPAGAVWRSMLTDQYARNFAKAGGIGIADHVQRALMAQQEAK